MQHYFVIVIFCLKLSSSGSQKTRTEYYKISYETSNEDSFIGFYKRQDENYSEMPLFKMLRQDKYLFLNHDDKWSLGTKNTKSRYDDKITMTVRDLDEPETGRWDSGSGEWVWKNEGGESPFAWFAITPQQQGRVSGLPTEVDLH